MRFRNYLILATLMLLTRVTVVAQEFSNTNNATEFDSKFVTEHFSNVYKVNPSMLSNWKFNDWSYIGADYDHEKGNFRDLQSYNRFSQLSIHTESVKKLDDKGWTFYGKFTYTNGGLDSVHNNISLNMSSSGSPYYHFIKMPGQWKTQHYIFNAIAAKSINQKLSVGLRLFYDGDLAFRQNDTRNNQTTLTTNVALSATYCLSGAHNLSLGFSYYRSKAEPKFSNKFQHESHDLTYNRYLNAGLGTYVKNITYSSVKMFDGSYGALGQWSFKNDSNEYSLLVEGHLGEDYVIDKERRDIDEQNKILKYDYKKASITAASLNNISGGHVYTVLKGSLIKGTGNIYNDVSKMYVGNYVSDIINFDFRSTLFKPVSFLNSVSIIVGGHKEERFDKNFGYTFNWFNLNAGIDLRLSKNIGALNLMLNMGAQYNKNIDFTHNPNAASESIYTSWIGGPAMSWLTSDFLDIPVGITCKVPTKNNLVEISINGGVLLPQKINYENDFGFTINDNFSYIKSSIKFYF